MKKSLLCFVVLLILWTSITAQGSPVITPIPPDGFERSGDMNFSYTHTAEDAQLVFMAILELWYQYLAGDCNGDDMLTAGDSSAIFISVLEDNLCWEPIPTPLATLTPTPTPMMNPNQISIPGYNFLGVPGDLTTLSVQIDNPDTAIDCFGFELQYDPSIAYFEEWELGNLSSDWLMIECVEREPGTIRCCGFLLDPPISAGSQGELLTITLVSTCDFCYWHEEFQYDFRWLVDDLRVFFPVSGYMEVAYVRTVHNGDANLDHMVSSEDAQLIFMNVLGLIHFDFQQFNTGDCNADLEITAEDAQMVFERALGLGICVDPV